VTSASRRSPLGKPFLVLATQNPIEHEAPTPPRSTESDRFMMKIKVGTLGGRGKKIMARVYEGAADQVAGVVEYEQVAAAARTMRLIPWKTRSWTTSSG